MRKSKIAMVRQSLHRLARHDSNQSDMWGIVNSYEHRKGKMSSTSDFLEVFKSEAARNEPEIRKIDLIPGKNGMAIFIGDSLASVEIFNRTDVFAEYFPKLLRSAMMDTDLYFEGRKISESAAIEELHTFSARLNKFPFENHKAVAEGTERRYEGNGVNCYELCYEDTSVHFAALLDVADTSEKIYRDRQRNIIINYGRNKGMKFSDLLDYDYDDAMRLILDPQLDDNTKRELFNESLRFSKKRGNS